MKVAVANDHRGYEAKRRVMPLIKKLGHEIEDFGCEGSTAVDYPDFAAPVARAVVSGSAEVGILMDGSGIGMSIAANKVPGVRATVAHDAFSVERSILSNDCQVLTLGQRVIGLELTRRLVREWITYRFDPASASAAKVDVISAYESR